MDGELRKIDLLELSNCRQFIQETKTGAMNGSIERYGAMCGIHSSACKDSALNLIIFLVELRHQVVTPKEVALAFEHDDFVDKGGHGVPA